MSPPCAGKQTNKEGNKQTKTNKRSKRKIFRLRRLTMESLLNVYSVVLVVTIAIFSFGWLLIWVSMAQFNEWTGTGHLISPQTRPAYVGKKIGEIIHYRP